MQENKKVTYRQLKKGQEIKGFEADMFHSEFTAYVKEVNPAYVTVEKWKIGGTEERIRSDATFLVPMAEEEIIEKYTEDAGKLVQAMQNSMNADEIGYKEMWNGWLSSDPWEMAQLCKKKKVTVIGHCRDIIPKTSYSGDVLDVGICAVDEDGERFWCHFRSRDVEMMRRIWEKRQQFAKEGKLGSVVSMTKIKFAVMDEMYDESHIFSENGGEE